MYAYVRVCTCTYWHVLVCTLMKFVHTSMYQCILVCTSIYQYVPVHTSTYNCVPVRTSTSLSMAALFCGRHDMVQGSTDDIMKCHDIVHTAKILRHMWKAILGSRDKVRLICSLSYMMRKYLRCRIRCRIRHRMRYYIRHRMRYRIRHHIRHCMLYYIRHRMRYRIRHRIIMNHAVSP